MYDLGLVGTGTLSKDLNRAWAKFRGKPDPYATIAELNDRTLKTESNIVYALKDINFKVEKGDVLGIVGKNGAGKSTLLKILSQITRPTVGDIKINGRIASLLEVGTGMHPEMTARQNIYLNGSIMGMTRKEIDSKLDEIVDFAGIGKYIDTPIKRFSSGMTVRLGFAVAAFLEPEILIVDEVLAVGDAEFQKKAIGKMKDVSSGAGRTVLFVSHNMESIQKLCSRCLVIDKGQISFDGETKSAINFYIKNNYSTSSEIELPMQINQITINRFEMISVSNVKINELILGEDILFSLKLTNNGQTPLSFILKYQIFDEALELITTINSFHYNFEKKIHPNETDEINFLFKKVNLKPGKYYLTLDIKDLLSKEIVHKFNNLGFFNINRGDFFKSGKLPSHKAMGKFLVNGEWR